MSAEIEALIGKRIEDLSDWLAKNAPECFEQQKHRDSGTQERVYWHYGYMVAARDILRLMRKV